MSKWIKPLSAVRGSTYTPPTNKEREDRDRRDFQSLMMNGQVDGIRGAWEDGAKRWGGSNCVYFIRMGLTDACKVGKSIRLRPRMKGLQIGSPVKLDVVAFVSLFHPDRMAPLERAAHRIASQIGRPLQGEWFELDSLRLLRVVETLTSEFRDDIKGVSYDGSHFEDGL